MKSYTLKSLSVYLSLALTLIFVVFLTINFVYHRLWFLCISVPILFVVTILIVNYILNSLVYDKLKPIYKIVRSIPVSDRKTKNNLMNSIDLINEVHREVEEWSHLKIAEIKRLKGLEKYRKDYIGNVSHELRTPIFNIQGYVLTLLDGGMDDPKINKLYLERTEKSVDRMISIVDDLESITKLEAGELKLNRTRFDIVQLAQEVFDLEERESTERNITLRFGKIFEKPITVYGDRMKIFDVLRNLIGNGVKYGSKGGFVKVGFYDMMDHIMVEITDNGVGIENDHVHRIFERFYRIDKSRSRKEGGTGLGLAIVKHILEAHNQSIQVKSALDKGSTFTFTLEK
ncbi:sensor histidine kinase [Halosquirtibacter xylanolyticus]|uniref:sensor histidine kinase n=1 Tax=Halosquirtibacter xylanolyticus TaxID=3374599 RepID=UPI003747F1EB|nr:sensor histidine kinase [Prolixibacteraceae bacterium]